jgi:hypothetical protein
MDSFTNCQSLKRISTIAKERNVSPQYIYRLVKLGKLQMVEIDKVQFVVPAPTELNKDQPPSA